MKRKSKFKIPSKYILMFLSAVCGIAIYVSFTMNLSGGPLNTVAGYVFVPMQRGINYVGSFLIDKADNLKNLKSVMAENQELKAWVAIARYMQSFDDTDGDGIANVSEYYATTHGRKVVENSRNLVQLLKNPNKFFMLMIGIVTVTVLIVLLLIFFIRKVLRKRR